LTYILIANYVTITYTRFLLVCSKMNALVVKSL